MIGMSKSRETGSFLMGIARKLLLITIIITILVISFIGFTCTNEGEQSGQTAELSVSTGDPGGQPVETPPINLPSYPKDWVPGTEGWIPPLPPGMNQPRSLTEGEWDRVIDIARTDAEVTKQIERDNVVEMKRYWVGYGGGPGFNSNTDSAIMAGEAKPPKGCWYYPAIKFVYRLRTDRLAQLVGVDLNANIVVLSNPSGQQVNRPSSWGR
jgi:hypothetical protein